MNPRPINGREVAQGLRFSPFIFNIYTKLLGVALSAAWGEVSSVY